VLGVAKMWVEVLVLLVLLVVLALQYFKKPEHMPPGTYGLPILGYLRPLDQPVREYVDGIVKRSGKVATVKWGESINIFVADPIVVKKVLEHPEMQERLDWITERAFRPEKDLGVVFAGGEVWKENRRFTIHHLRNLGLGKSSIEHLIVYEVDMFIKYIEEKHLGHPTDIDCVINLAVVNVLFKLSANIRFEAEDAFFVKFCESLGKALELRLGPCMLVNFFPWIMKVCPTWLFNRITKLDEIVRIHNEIWEMCKKIVKDHKKNLDPENPKDLLDHYLLEGRDKDNEEFPDPITLMDDLFLAGSETTSNTIRWFVLYMATWPDIQKRIHDLMDEHVPKGKLPSMDDRENLVYLEAAVYDTLRLSALIPLGLPHRATATVNICGYNIPKGTTVLSAVDYCHRDPAYWKEPERLHPEHFIDKNGQLDVNQPAFMPFGLGRRLCIGHSLAKAELFMFCGALLQKFTIEFPPGAPSASLLPEPAQYMINVPKPFKVIFRRRY